MLLDGIQIAQEMQQKIAHSFAQSQFDRPPCLAVILVGEHPASKIYIQRKRKACELLGFHSILKNFPSDFPENTLLREIQELNDNPTVDGILVQLPLPEQIRTERVIEAVSPEKDVDGFHPINLGKLLLGREDGFLPCTPFGIHQLLLRSGVEISGKQVVILGRSNIVGKPLAGILMQNKKECNATVTLAHRQTRFLTNICRQAEILVVAMGHPHFVKADMVREGAVVVDVGINKVEDPTQPRGYKIVGDVDFEALFPKCSWITPVPGGVGPMTIAALMHNTFKSFEKRVQVQES